MKRTSLTDPLQIAEIPFGKGAIGITFCPGKKGESVFGAAWDRDLQIDLCAIETWGASTVVTLIESHEFDLLHVGDLPQEMAGRFDWIHIPIRDLGIPCETSERIWSTHTERLIREVRGGKKVLFHCRGGLGRAGLMAARLLLDGGMSAEMAIRSVRKVRKGAIETVQQEQYLRHHPSFISHASMLGLAVGDALGAEIEFAKLPQIQKLFPNKVDRLLPAYGKLGAITDDTQMTLFTAEGVVRTIWRASTKGIGSPSSVIHHALLRWLVTQGEEPPVEVDEKVGLVKIKSLHARRAPGLTCLDALRKAEFFDQKARNNSKGCGTIMRVAPLAFGLKREFVREFAIETSALTHGHPTGQLAAAFWAELLADVMNGRDLELYSRSLVDQYRKIDGADEVVAAAEKARSAVRDGTPQTVATLGEGWIAEECLAIALYAALSTTNFKDGISVALKHSGDSDSCGAVAGSLLGIMYPEEVFAFDCTSLIELQECLRKLSKDLVNVQSFDFTQELRDPFYSPW